MSDRPYPDGIAWDEALRQRQRADAAADEIERLRAQSAANWDSGVAESVRVAELQAEIERLQLENNRLHTECGHLETDCGELRAGLRDIATRGTGIGGSVYVDSRTLRDIAKCALEGRWNPINPV